MTLTHQERTRLYNRLNLAIERLREAKATAKQAEIDIIMWAREAKEVRKDLEEERE